MGKQGSLLLKLINSVQDDELDFTLKRCKFLIMDTELSGNGQVMSEDIIRENMHTLKDKPIVAKYYPIQDGNDDYLGDHEQYLSTDRHGEITLTSDTETIGHFTTGGYIEDYNGTPSLMCDGVFHVEKYPDVIELLQEWIDGGIQINSSVEYYYANYDFRDGIEYIQSPVVFSAHCILNSAERGESKVIDGAYSNSQLLSMNMKKSWNKALENNKNQETGGIDNMELTKSINELSVGKIASKIYEVFSKIMTADEFNKMWISDYNIYQTYFVYEMWTGNGYEYYKIEYSIDENDEMVFDPNAKVKVEKSVDWIESKNQLETSISEKETKIEELEKSVNELNEKVEGLTGELGTANETIFSLNSIAEKYEQEETEKKLNQALENYKTKFESVNALEKFESEEVQSLIKESLNDVEAQLSLNNMIVDLIPTAKSTNQSSKEKPIMGKSMSNLIPEQPKTVASKYFN